MGVFDQVDKDALDLTHAIALAESGSGGKPNYNAVGDNGTSKGAYQWQPGNYESAAKEAGLDPTDFSPTNQDKVAYYQVKKYKDEGLQPHEIASLWNSGSKSNYQNHSGDTVINGKTIHYDTPAYVGRVKQEYLKLKGNPQSPQTGSTPTAQAATTQPQQPENTLQKAGDVVGTVGNFLFPVAGDIGAALQGKTDKSALQIAGDTALSALPFIPGLGEAGLAAKGVEGAGLLAKTAGVASKLLPESTIARGAITGYGAGVAGNLSQGQDLGQSFMPSINTVGGAGLGALAPVLLKSLSATTKGLSGVTPQIENALKDSGMSVSDYNKYITAAKTRTGDIRATSPLTLAANELDKAANTVKAQRVAAGEAVGAAKDAAAKTPINDVTPAIQQFADRIKKDYGIALTIGQNGKVLPTFIQGRFREVPPTIRKRIVGIYDQLNSLKKNGTIQKAVDVRDNLEQFIDRKNIDNFGRTLDPLEGLITTTRRNVADIIGQTSPEIAKVNETFSNLKGLEKEIGTMAGKNLQKGELLMKRVFSGDKSGEVQDFFQKIKDATGIDLVNHAVLAKHAIDVAGDSSQQSLLHQMIQGGNAASQGLIPLLTHIAQKVGQKTLANPETIGRQAVQGKEGILSSLLNQGGTKAAIELSRGLLPITGFK